MRKTLITALIMGYAFNCFAQNMTLEQACTRWTLPLQYPKATAWNEAGMPYEPSANDKKEDYYATSSDGHYALDFTNTRRVWRYNTRGDFYLVDLKTGSRRQLGKNLPESSLQFAKFSPDGTRVAYESKNNIYMEYCDSITNNEKGRITVTTDGNDKIINGTFDWVYEEELDLRDGFRWSGDGQFIAYWQSDTEGTGTFDIIDNVDSIYPTVKHFPYPKAGTTNSAVRIGFTRPGTLKTEWLEIPGDPRNNYLAWMEFVPGTDRLMIQQLNRAQNNNTVWNIDLNTNKGLCVLCTDKDSAWVEVSDNIHFLQGNKFFTFTSERDGWRHIYRVSIDGKKWTCITPGNFDVVEEVSLDEKNGYLYYIGTEKEATQRYLYRSRLDGKGKAENISLSMKRDGQTVETGQYSYNMSPTNDHAIESFSNSQTPTQFRRVSMNAKGKWQVDSLLVNNNDVLDKAKEIGLQTREMVKCKSNNIMLDAWIIKPANFDPTKKYPVICYIYGEPASSTVQDRWETNLFWQYLAQQGYVVVSIDPRGTHTPRGREWRKCIYGEVGVAASEDITNGILDLCRQFSWMDRDRLGITGWSGGGAQTLNCMFHYPDVFKAGIAIAFVSDQKLYDTIYQERYMNTPQTNPGGYFKGSPINFTSGLKGRLLIVHGTGDDNVHYQNTERLVNELIKNGKVFYQLSYPMRTHGIYEGEGTSLHLRKQLVDFWQHNL